MPLRTNLALLHRSDRLWHGIFTHHRCCAIPLASVGCGGAVAHCVDGIGSIFYAFAASFLNFEPLVFPRVQQLAF